REIRFPALVGDLLARLLEEVLALEVRALEEPVALLHRLLPGLVDEALALRGDLRHALGVGGGPGLRLGVRLLRLRPLRLERRLPPRHQLQDRPPDVA